MNTHTEYQKAYATLQFSQKALKTYCETMASKYGEFVYAKMTNAEISKEWEIRMAYNLAAFYADIALQRYDIERQLDEKL